MKFAVIAALVIGAVTGASIMGRRVGNLIEIKRSGEVLEVWKGPELVGEYEPKDGEVYEFLRDVDKNRL